MIRCAVCPKDFFAEDGLPYAIGRIKGQLCPECAQSMRNAFTVWMHNRMETLARETEVELARLRLARLAAEGVPLPNRAGKTRAA